MSCGVGCRHASDPALLWLWYKLAAAVPIQLLALELPYAVGGALKSKKKKKKKNKKRKIRKKKNQKKREYLKKELSEKRKNSIKRLKM